MNQPLKKQNLILNSQWLPGPDGEPLYFTSTGTTGSQNCIAGHYTRCVSLNGLDSQKAEDRYDMPIDVRGVHGGITWGYMICADEAENVFLAADFYDAAGRLFRSVQTDISPWIRSEPHRRVARFRIPADAATVRLSHRFEGRITNAVFYAPAAYFD